ncbi:MAG: PE-PPE domain-containing protein [Mycobacterium sp.]
MTYVTIQPDLMSAAAADAEQISSAISTARAAAAGPTTGLVAAAEDEVSAITASLFGAYGQEYQALLRKAAAFHEEFVAALSAAGNAYAGTEVAASNALSTLQTDVQALLAGNPAPAAATTTLVLGASGLPIPPPDYIAGIPPLYINPFFGPGTNVGVFTPEGLYPLTGIKDLTFDVSVARGLTILNNTIQSTIQNGTTQINVFGYSQSAAIVSLEMQALNPTNTPGGSLLPPGVSLNVTLVGDVSNPNGGLLARFPGLSLPSLGFTFGTATPDNSFPSRIYTIEYDGFADFPQYPLDFPSDLNAFFGIIYLHGQYPFLSSDQIMNAIQLTNTVGPTQTEYFVVPSQDLPAHLQGLPLLNPVRAIPVIGNPIADLLQPDLRVLVDLGYGSTTQGWSPNPPNVPTQFGVIPPVSPHQVLTALGAGAQQGIGAFTGDISAGISPMPHHSLPSLTSLLGSGVTAGSGLLSGALTGLTSTLSSPNSFITALQSASTNFTNAISSAASAAYATLLPTADLANALLISVPSYDINLFLSGVEQIADGNPIGGLEYAFGAPLAADTALLTLFGGFEFRVLEHAATSIIGDFTTMPTVPMAPPAPPETVTL